MFPALKDKSDDEVAMAFLLSKQIFDEIKPTLDKLSKNKRDD